MGTVVVVVPDHTLFARSGLQWMDLRCAVRYRQAKVSSKSPTTSRFCSIDHSRSHCRKQKLEAGAFTHKKVRTFLHVPVASDLANQEQSSECVRS